MMRQIDADALKISILKEGKRSRRHKAGESWELNRSEIYKVIDEQPTINSERESIKWIPHKSVFGESDERVYTCSKCGHNIGFHVENFCPNCGGKYER